MADKKEKRLIDSVVLNERLWYLWMKYGELPCGEDEKMMQQAIKKIIGIIERESTVDAVEVVRCRDCKFWDNGDCYRLELSSPDDYCSYGERKDSIK